MASGPGPADTRVGEAVAVEGCWVQILLEIQNSELFAD